MAYNPTGRSSAAFEKLYRAALAQMDEVATQAVNLAREHLAEGHVANHHLEHLRAIRNLIRLGPAERYGLCQLDLTTTTPQIADAADELRQVGRAVDPLVAALVAEARFRFHGGNNVGNHLTLVSDALQDNAVAEIEAYCRADDADEDDSADRSDAEEHGTLNHAQQGIER